MRLAGLVRLPAGARAAKHRPREAPASLDAPAQRPAVPGLIDVTRWWLVRLAPGAVAGYVQSHPPHGLIQFESGSQSASNGVQEVYAAFGVAGPPSVGDVRTLLVAVAAAPGGGSVVRADALVEPSVRRPSAEHIPASARVVDITVTRFATDVRPPLHVTRATQVAHLRQLINGLPMFPPGTHSCPVDEGVRVSFAFRRRRAATPLALAVANLTGCGTVSFARADHRYPTLAGGPRLIAGASRLLGINLIPGL